MAITDGNTGCRCRKRKILNRYCCRHAVNADESLTFMHLSIQIKIKFRINSCVSMAKFGKLHQLLATTRCDVICDGTVAIAFHQIDDRMCATCGDI